MTWVGFVLEKLIILWKKKYTFGPYTYMDPKNGAFRCFYLKQAYCKHYGSFAPLESLGKKWNMYITIVNFEEK